MHIYTNAKNEVKSSDFRSENTKITCSIVGARGYSGLELARILLQHPYANLKYCFATSDFKLENYLSNASSARVQCYADREIFNYPTDVVFLATPAEVSLELAPKLLATGAKVVDLSGAFRLKSNSYSDWYGFEHTQTELLLAAEYGLTAFLAPANKSMLVANPGCYATAISMALIPVLKENVISENSIVIDAKSGTTGAGKKATENLIYSEVAGDCLPYKVGKHQHLPEIIEAVEAFAGKSINPAMSTSLLSERRGIIAAIYCDLKTEMTEKNVEEAFAKNYSDNNFIKYTSLSKNKNLLSLRKVVGTPHLHISYEVVGQKLYLFSCIDNLLKGAASQAVENFNRIMDFPIHTGLSQLEAQI